jgi:hypothetical protein
MKQIPISVFLLALLWAAISAMAPVGVLLWRWVSLWQDPPDWRIIGPVAITCAGTGAWGFYQKYKAQIALPPAWAEARDLLSQMKTVTTVETVEQQTHPTATVTTTVQETKMTPIEPTAITPTKEAPLA